MAYQSLMGGSDANIVPIPLPSKLLDPLFLEAHRLVDLVPRGKMAELIPLLCRAADHGGNGLCPLRTVEKYFFHPAAGMEPSMPGTVAAQAPTAAPELP